MFMEITISIDLSAAMDKEMPKNSPWTEERAAINAHYNVINNITESAVHDIVQALGNAGYLASA